MKRKRLLSLLLALAMVLTVLPAAGALAAGEEYAQNTSGAAVKVYTSADETSAEVGELAAGEKVAYLGATGDWYQIKSGTIEGYVLAAAMTLLQPELTVTSGKYPYDGKPHTVTYKLENADGYTVTYSTDGGTKWVTTAPSLTEPGKLTVKVKASKTGEKDLVAEAVLEVTPATTTATMATVVNCSESVNVRKGPSSSTTKLGTAKKDAQFKVLGVEGDWYKVQYTATSAGYIHKNYISTQSVTETPETPVIKPAGDNEIVTIVNCKVSVNVRSGAGTSYSPVGTAPKAAEYKLLARVSVGSVIWYKVQYTSSKEGYIHQDYIKTGTGTPSTPTSGNTITIVNCNTSVNVREGASSSTKLLGTAEKGKVYEYLGRTVDGKWYQIQYTATQKGFVYSQYVKVNSGTVTPPADDKPTTGKIATIVNCNSFVNVREGASSSTKLLGTARKDATYNVTGQSGSWIQVQYTATQKGYIYSKYVKLSDGSSTTPTPPAETAATGYGYVVNCKTSVNVRSGAGTSYSIIGTAPKSQVYQILGRSGDWYKVQYNATTVGYIYNNYFAKATGDTTQKATVINCKVDVNVRSAATTSSTLLGTAKLDETFTFLKMMNNYAMVIYNGRVGCIHKNYVKVG